MEALKLYTSPADLLLKITTPYERVKTRLKEIPRPPSSFTVSSPSSKSESIDPLSTVTTPTTTTEPSPDRTTAAVSILPTPQVFLVQKFYVSPGMLIHENIQDIWTQQIKSRLSAILWRKIPSGTCVQEFMMVGKRPDALRPTVIITCGDQMTTKRVEKIFKDQAWLQELLKANHMDFIALTAKTLLSAGLVSHDEGIETFEGSYAVQLPRAQVPTSCGLELLINSADSHQRQRCTLGGLLMVKGRVMGLTAGHPFSGLRGGFRPRKLLEATDDMDNPIDEESNSISSEPYVFHGDSDDDENDSLVSSSMPPFERAESLPIPIDRLAWDRHKYSEKPQSVEWSVPQAAILPFSTPRYVTSIEDLPKEVDWALLESLPLSVRVRPNAILDADQLAYTSIKGISSNPTCGRVVVNAARVELQRGYLHSSPVNIQVNGTILEVQLVVLDIVLPIGSSGAWVVRGDKLCGFIVAIRQDIPWAYMVAIQSVLEDIGRKFKTDDVRLPTAAEIESFNKVLEPELGLATVPEGTQVLSSEGHQNETPASDFTETEKARKELHMADQRTESKFDMNTSSSPMSLFSRDISVAADSFRPELPAFAELRSPAEIELPGDLNEPTPYPRTQGVSNHSTSTRKDEPTGPCIALMPSQMDLEAAIQTPPRRADLSTSKIAVFAPVFRRSVNHLGQVWQAFEALILRIEYRRRRERSRFSVVLVRLMWKPMRLTDFPWTSAKGIRWIDYWFFYSQYYTIFMFGNILLNLLYCIFLFPFILWVLYRHHDVLERPRTQKQFQASIEMLGRLPERYEDYHLLRQRFRHNLESGPMVF